MNVQEIIRYQLFTIGDTPVTVATVVVALGVAIATFVIAYLAEKGAIRFLGRRGVKNEGSASATARLVYYAVLATGLAVALSTMGINLTALFTAGAFLAVALGFAMQNITQNFVSGLILLSERAITPGDIIEVEGRLVRVTRLGMRATVVRTRDSEDYIIPNLTLVSTSVKNLTLRDHSHRVRSVVGVRYGSDMRKVREVLKKVASEQPWRDQAIEPVILMKEFGSSSVNFDVSVWTDDPFRRELNRSLLNEAIWFALLDADITIAFPQLDVHLDEPVVEAIRRSDGAT